MLNVTGDYKGVGDIAHIAVQGTAYTVGNISNSDGTFTPQSNTLTDATITIDQRRVTAVHVIKHVRIQSFEERFRNFPENAGAALKEDIENQLLALYSGVSQNSGDGLGNAGEDEVLDAIRQLATTPKLPVLKSPGEFAMAFHPRQIPSLRKSGALDWSRTGQTGGGAKGNADVPSFYNIPVIFTAQVAAASSIHYNLLAHRTAFAWASLRMPMMESASGLANQALTDIMAVWTLFGVATIVANRAVRIRTAT